MKNKIGWLMVSLLIILPLVSICCSSETTAPAATTLVPVATTSASAESHWWDKMGEPQYGGTIVERPVDINAELFDPITPLGPKNTYTAYYLDSLFEPNWTVGPDKWDFKVEYIPSEYFTGSLAESWEQTDLLTWTVTIRQGVHFENRAPVNGRELTAADVEYSYDRLLGTGNGFTEPNPYWAPMVPNLARVRAVDDYTVEFKFKQASAFNIQDMMQSVVMRIVPHEWVEQGDLNNWRNAIGSGPFIMKEYIAGSSMSFNRNPDYWGVDERHPENRLPYIDTYKVVQVPDWASSLAALRTRKIDVVLQVQTGMSLSHAESLAKSNPEIVLDYVPSVGFSVLMRCDTAPFADIRVRTAMQMAMDLDMIAQFHYKGLINGKPCGLVNPIFEGFATPFDDWPADLRQEYTYNPSEAKKLLAEAGYPNGFDTKCMIMKHMDVELLEIMKDMLSDVGVDMEIDAREGAALMPLFVSGKYEQMSFWGQTGATFNPRVSMNYRQSKNSMNFTKNNDAHYDDLMAQFNASTELDEAQRISREANLYLLEQHWSIQTFPNVKPTAHQPYVKGWNGEVLNFYWSYLAARVWIDQDMKSSMGSD